jgi:hypothetical protein
MDGKTTPAGIVAVRNKRQIRVQLKSFECGAFSNWLGMGRNLESFAAIPI